jgi:uncharacterized protein YqgC (DUF456 family)
MAFSADLWLWLLAFALIAVGIAGTVLPALPGPPLVFGGLLLGAWIDNFQRVGYLSLAVLGALTLLSVVVDIVAGFYGAKRVGASPLALLGAALGTIFGIFLGIPGLILGPFVGALAGELISHGNAIVAGRVAFGAWLGMLLAVAVKLALVGSMIGLFLLAYLL